MPSSDKHAHRGGRCLNDGGDTHDKSANEDGRTTSKSICKVRRDGVGSQATNVLGRNESLFR